MLFDQADLVVGFTNDDNEDKRGIRQQSVNWFPRCNFVGQQTDKGTADKKVKEVRGRRP